MVLPLFLHLWFTPAQGQTICLSWYLWMCRFQVCCRCSSRWCPQGLDCCWARFLSKRPSCLCLEVCLKGSYSQGRAVQPFEGLLCSQVFGRSIAGRLLQGIVHSQDFQCFQGLNRSTGIRPNSGASLTNWPSKGSSTCSYTGVAAGCSFIFIDSRTFNCILKPFLSKSIFFFIAVKMRIHTYDFI